jgi:hypothetical protein
MIDIEYLYFAVTMMATLGYYLSHRHGNQEYDNGFIDAVQLHSEGRLAYTMESIGEHENVLTIEVFEDES